MHSRNLIPALLALSTALIFAACAASPKKPTPAPEAKPAETKPAETKPAETKPAAAPAKNATGCAVKNATAVEIELVDTAINESRGKVAPGATGSVGGHFAAKANGMVAKGYCPTGSSLTVQLKDGKLTIVGGGANEGVGP